MADFNPRLFPCCEICGDPMALGQRKRHYSCRAGDDDGGWDALAGKRCTCPPGCTTGDIWGDGPRDCAADCEPCRIRAGQPYFKPNAKPAEARK